jgi:PAS domain S-box-containing protein
MNKDMEGEFLGIEGIARDITEHRHSEDALRREYSVRNAIIENIAEGLSVCHETTEYRFIKFTIWNNGMTEITGYTMEEINRLGWYQTVYPDPELQAKATESMERMRQGKDLHGEKWKITRADGNGRILNISTSVVESDDGLVHVLALMQDITERKRAEQDIRESRQMLLQVLDAIPVRVFWKDKESRYLGCNRHFAADAGLDSLDALVCKDDFQMSWASLAATLKRPADPVARFGGEEFA